MTQEDKQLLYNDLAARQPYRPFICFAGKVTMPFLDVIASTESNELMSINGLGLDDVKVYLRPMSSMTEEELKELNEKYGSIAYFFIQEPPYYHGLQAQHEDIGSIEISEFSKIYDWLNAHHFDYRCLIEKGLAFEAPEGMYKTE